jgi:hypothetical protein
VVTVHIRNEIGVRSDPKKVSAEIAWDFTDDLKVCRLDLIKNRFVISR